MSFLRGERGQDTARDTGMEKAGDTNEPSGMGYKGRAEQVPGIRDVHVLRTNQIISEFGREFERLTAIAQTEKRTELCWL